MLPRIVVAADEDGELGALLANSVASTPGPFNLEFCGDRGALPDRIRAVRPAALVVALHDPEGASSAPLVEQLRRHYPRVPVLVACLDEDTHGHDVLSAARAGAEHFAFSGIDDLAAVLRGLVSASGEPRSVQPAGATDGDHAAGRAGDGDGEGEGEGPTPGANQPAGRRTPRNSGRWERIERSAPTRLGPTSWTRHRLLSRDRRRTPVLPALLPSSVPPLVRRIIHGCLGVEPLARVGQLAQLLGTTRHSLQRALKRRGLPSPKVLLRWGSLFRGALVAEEARLAGTAASRETIAAAAGYRSVKGAMRGYRRLANVGLRSVSRDGVAALLPAFFTATGQGSRADEGTAG